MQEFGIKSHQIVVNFMTLGHNLHFVEDKDKPPAIHAENFADPDPSKALPAEELLRQARLIIATELGSDPLLRQHVRDLFKDHGVISTLPTERGKKRIGVLDPAYVCDHYMEFNFSLTPFSFRISNIFLTSQSQI